MEMEGLRALRKDCSITVRHWGYRMNKTKKFIFEGLTD